MATPKATGLEAGFESFWEEMLSSHALVTDLQPDRSFVRWIRVNRDLYLFHTSDRTTPGDLCGQLRYRGWLGPQEEALAFLLDPRPEYSYIPDQAMANAKFTDALKQWKRQAEDWYLVSRPAGSA